MKQEKILEPWKKWSGDFVNADAFIETLYNSLTNEGRIRSAQLALLDATEGRVVTARVKLNVVQRRPLLVPGLPQYDFVSR